MFYYKYSKLTRFTVIFNMIYAIGSLIYYSYQHMLISASEKMILAYMRENGVIRDTAIRALQNSGEVLHFSTANVVVGINLAIACIILLLFFRKNNAFLLVMVTALACTLLNFVGGAFLFFLMFTNRLESEEYKTRTS